MTALTLTWREKRTAAGRTGGRSGKAPLGNKPEREGGPGPEVGSDLGREYETTAGVRGLAWTETSSCRSRFSLAVAESRTEKRGSDFGTVGGGEGRGRSSCRWGGGTLAARPLESRLSFWTTVLSYLFWSPVLSDSLSVQHSSSPHDLNSSVFSRSIITNCSMTFQVIWILCPLECILNLYYLTYLN
jgi:hypothetical protein